VNELIAAYMNLPTEQRRPPRLLEKINQHLQLLGQKQLGRTTLRCRLADMAASLGEPVASPTPARVIQVGFFQKKSSIKK
jgi:hypothetical protein